MWGLPLKSGGFCQWFFLFNQPKGWFDHEQVCRNCYYCPKINASCQQCKSSVNNDSLTRWYPSSLSVTVHRHYEMHRVWGQGRHRMAEIDESCGRQNGKRSAWCQWQVCCDVAIRDACKASQRWPRNPWRKGWGFNIFLLGSDLYNINWCIELLTSYLPMI